MTGARSETFLRGKILGQRWTRQTHENQHKSYAELYCGLHCTQLNCTTLHCTASHCIALHCTALHCNALHRTTLRSHITWLSDFLTICSAVMIHPFKFWVQRYGIPKLERGNTVLLLLLLLLLLCHAQGPPPGFWNGVDWRALVKPRPPNIGTLRG